MSMFEKLNKNTKLFSVEIEEPIFIKLRDFAVGQVLRVDGMYINNKSVYGEEPIFIVFDGEKHLFTHLPKYHIDTIKTIISDSEMVAGVNNGECYIKVTSYFSKKYNKQCFDIEFTAKPEKPLVKEHWKPSEEINTIEGIF